MNIKAYEYIPMYTKGWMPYRILLDKDNLLENLIELGHLKKIPKNKNQWVCFTYLSGYDSLRTYSKQAKDICYIERPDYSLEVGTDTRHFFLDNVRLISLRQYIDA